MSTDIRIQIDRQTEDKLRELYDRFGCTAEKFAETAVAVAVRQFSEKTPPAETLVRGATL